ncbi:hypothetical protein [Salinicola aestuarinus]|uniref:hypothetical protein n=1 Tax=Salinicola aestuarinus TaxID=1949082 RepID=UPI0013003402|nr:hypothetical protein [Salinicola aestuarinus]
MMKVTLDLSCSICGHTQFQLPTRADEGSKVCCANCTAFKCHAMDLERALMAIGQPRPSPRPAIAA